MPSNYVKVGVSAEGKAKRANGIRRAAISKAEALVGNKYGRWTMTGGVFLKDPNSGKGPRRAHATFLCECGTEAVRDVHTITAGYSKSCGCLRVEVVKLFRMEPDRELGALRCQYNNYRNAAKRRGIEFQLSLEEFGTLAVKDCHYCGANPSLDKGKVHPDFSEFKWQGIDRIDSNGPYSIGNCVPCDERCNVAKNVMGRDAFEGWIRDAAAHLENRVPRLSPQEAADYVGGTILERAA